MGLRDDRGPVDVVHPSHGVGLAVFSYLLGLFSALFVLAIAKQDDLFTRFHATQSAYVSVAGLLPALFVYAALGGGPGVLMAGVVILVVFVITMVAMFSAFSGNCYPIPGIGRRILERLA